ncbi:MAG TPA: hypothetical protein ENI20_11525 [Bacteroides sp.]|nr:hypothetical protein [Bacteroides sp.]
MQKIIIIIIFCLLSSYGIAQDVECDLITNNTTYLPVPEIDKPGYLKSVWDPTFGTKITRIVGEPGDTSA